jgi:hypothetical protein
MHQVFEPLHHDQNYVLYMHQVFEEHDEEVQEALAAEAAGPRADRDSELKPVHHKQGDKHGSGVPDEDGDDDDDDDVGRGTGMMTTTMMWVQRRG